NEIIKLFLEDHPNYKDIDGFFNNEIIPVPKCIRLYKGNTGIIDVFPQVLHIDNLSTIMEVSCINNYNTLGIGAYKNSKDTFSRIEDRLEYVERNVNFTPEFKITYDKNKSPAKELIIDFMNKLEEQVGDPPDGVDFHFRTQVISCNHDTQDIDTKRFLFVNYKVSTKKNIEDYLIKLDEFLKNW
ncbi:MAG: hypothetical protein ACOC3V_05810, partial [bacterium]